MTTNTDGQMIVVVVARGSVTVIIKLETSFVSSFC